MRNKQIIDRYATLIYLDYTRRNKVLDVHDYPDYIADENGLGFSIPFIKGMFKKGLLEENEGFAVTTKGNEFLAEGADYLNFFNINSPYVSIVDYEKFSSGSEAEGLSFKEKMVRIFEEKLVEYRQKKDYVAIESLNIELAELAIDMGDERKAMFHCLTSLAVAISGIKDYIYISRFKKNKITRNELMIKIRDCVYVHPGVILAIEKLKDQYSDELVEEVYDTLKLGYTLCSRERFKELAKTIMAGEYNNAYWQAQITDIFRKRMGFVVPQNKKAEEKIEKQDLGQSEPEQDATQILGSDDKEAEDVVAVSDAKMDEIAEKAAAEKELPPGGSRNL